MRRRRLPDLVREVGWEYNWRSYLGQGGLL